MLLCAFAISQFTKAHAEASAVSKAEGIHERWIDRIDLSNAKYAEDLYGWLVENSDNDGENDVLIDLSESEHEIVVIDGSFTVDVSAGALEDLVNAKLAEVANANFNEVADYCSMVYAAFNRDVNEAFWLRRDLITLSSISCSYNGNGEVTYSQTVNMVIKSDDADLDYDIRLSSYADGTLDVKEEIAAVNNAIEGILSGVEDEASSYEKVKYFNKWLTENNCYAANVTENSRDARGALLGQDGSSPYAPVCEGYARALKVLCDRANIPCVLSSGLGDGEDHMWNLVKMDDGKWYGVDVTWNDPVLTGVFTKKSGSENERFLLVGANTYIIDKKFGESHVESNKAYEDRVSFDNGPKLENEKYQPLTVRAEWNISDNLQVDSVSATLYQLADHTIAKPSYKLIISGNGKAKEYLSENSCPWKSYTKYIKEIEIRSNVTEMQGVPFKELTNLKNVKIYGDLKLGEGAFAEGEIAFYCHKGFACYQKLDDLGYAVFEICQIDNWEVSVAKTCEQDEVLKGVCSVCGFEKTKEGEKASGHDYGNELSHDKDRHWYGCENCNEKKDIESHKLSDWITEKEPTALTSGLKVRRCACGYTEQEKIERKDVSQVFGNIDIKKIIIAVACVAVPIILFLLFFVIKCIFRR